MNRIWRGMVRSQKRIELSGENEGVRVLWASLRMTGKIRLKIRVSGATLTEINDSWNTPLPIPLTLHDDKIIYAEWNNSIKFSIDVGKGLARMVALGIIPSVREDKQSLSILKTENMLEIQASSSRPSQEGSICTCTLTIKVPDKHLRRIRRLVDEY